jgi:hypothetical protein
MSDEPNKDQENEVEGHSKRPSNRPLLSEPTDELEDNEVEAHSKRPSNHPSARA